MNRQAGQPWIAGTPAARDGDRQYGVTPAVILPTWCMVVLCMLVFRVRSSLPTCRAGHPAWRRCSSLKYSRYSRSSRLASRAPRSGILASYFALGTLVLSLGACSAGVAPVEVRGQLDADEAPAVEVRVIVQREHRRDAARYLRGTVAALRTMTAWVGPSP